MIAAALAALRGLKIAQLAWQYRGVLKWVAIGLAFAVVAGLWRWERHDRIAAEKGERAAVTERDLARADAERWHQASDLRDRALAQRDAAITRQNAAIEKWRASAEQAEAAEAAAERASRQAREAFDARQQQLEEEAHAHPQDVRDLGPIVLRRVGGLFD